jgi:hypothetical protein
VSIACDGSTTSVFAFSAAAAGSAERRSIRYPLVELITMALFVLHGMSGGVPSSSTPVFACAMVVLFAIDLEHQLLQRHHAARIVVGLIASWCCRRASSGSHRRRHWRQRVWPWRASLSLLGPRGMGGGREDARDDWSVSGWKLVP